MPYRIAVQICPCRNLLGLAALSSLFLPGGCVDVCAGSAAIPIVEPSDSGICGENFEDFSTFRQVLANGCMLCDSRALSSSGLWFPAKGLCVSHASSDGLFLAFARCSVAAVIWEQSVALAIRVVKGSEAVRNENTDNT